MIAPDPTDARLAAIEARPSAPESWERRVENAARAMCEADFPGRDTWDGVPIWQELYRARATAALIADAATTAGDTDA